MATRGCCGERAWKNLPLRRDVVLTRRQKTVPQLLMALRMIRCGDRCQTNSATAEGEQIIRTLTSKALGSNSRKRQNGRVVQKRPGQSNASRLCNSSKNPFKAAP